MIWFVNPAHGTTLAYQLKQQITWLIVTKKLKAGEQLPAHPRAGQEAGYKPPHGSQCLSQIGVRRAG